MAVYAIRPWEQTEAGPSADQPLGEQREAPTPEALKKQVTAVAERARPTTPVVPGAEATISLKESQQAPPPKPPPSGTTNSQWYKTGH